jgi:hypothetical protein
MVKQIITKQTQQNLEQWVGGGIQDKMWNLGAEERGYHGKQNLAIIMIHCDISSLRRGTVEDCGVACCTA